MASHSMDPRTAAEASAWYGPSPTFNRSYLMAALRATVIALVLLGVLALIVLV